MKHFLSYAPLIALALLLSQPIASAGTLTINTSMTIREFENRIEVEVSVTNRGPDITYKVGVTLYALDQTWSSDFIKKLPVEGTNTFKFGLTLTEAHRGSYPITADVIYHDENRHPFSSLTCTTFSIKKGTRSTFGVTAGDIVIHPKGDLILKVTGTEAPPKEVRATLVLPSTIKANRKKQTFQLGKGHKTLVFPIANQQALPGSQHRYHFFLEYNQNGRHYSTITGGQIKIGGQIKAGQTRTNWLAQTRWYWLTGMGAWLLIWAVWGLFGVKRQRDRGA